VEPATLEAVIVKIVLGIACVGVPEIAPVLVLKLSPCGNVLSIVYKSTVSETVGVKVEMTIPVIKAGGLIYRKLLGGGIVTVMSTVVDPVFVEFVPIMVNVILGICLVEAPEMIPVLVSKFNPAGNVGLMVNELTAVPFLFGNKGVVVTVS
jgi:hypothetical protein